MALTDNLVAYYKLDESSGNASDSVGGNTATNSNVTYSAGKINNGATFNGTNANFITTSNLGITGSAARSYAFWIKPTTQSGYILDYGPVVATNRFLIYFAGSGNVGVNTWEPQDMNTNTGTVFTNGSWTHIVVTYSGGVSLNSTSTKIYANGEIVSTNNPSTSTLNTTNSTQSIGSALAGGARCTCMIDEVGVWSRELSQAEVSQLYADGGGSQYPLFESRKEVFMETKQMQSTMWKSG